MASKIDIGKVIEALSESNLINLDVSLREIVSSPAVRMVNAADLEPWDLICYTWVTFLRRREFDEPVLPQVDPRIAKPGTRG